MEGQKMAKKDLNLPRWFPRMLVFALDEIEEIVARARIFPGSGFFVISQFGKRRQSFLWILLLMYGGRMSAV